MIMLSLCKRIVFPFQNQMATLQIKIGYDIMGAFFQVARILNCFHYLF